MTIFEPVQDVQKYVQLPKNHQVMYGAKRTTKRILLLQMFATAYFLQKDYRLFSLDKKPLENITKGLCINSLFLRIGCSFNRE